METLHNMSPMVNFSQASSFSQLPDEDFLALLQKEFPNGSYDFSSINPQNILNYPLPTLTPPSEDSSPSPPSTNNDSNSPTQADDEGADQALKRKASDEDLEEGPSQKNQHTLSNKKGAATTTRRKSSGSAPPKDESRLMKRKEQNRAAQRAFRERKEKHVKDLEDKVAALEAKNEQTQSENENLKDLLSRLQSENVLLRSSTFTFTMPKAAIDGTPFNQTSTTDAHMPMYSSSSNGPSAAVSPAASSSSASPKPSFPSTIDWNALTTFDPSMLTVPDEAPQSMSSDSSIFNFGDSSSACNTPYTTIASNPTFMSYASMFDSTPTSATTETSSFTYDMSSVMSTWSPPPPTNDTNSLDDLFGGMLSSPPSTLDFNVLLSHSPSLSPISHHTSVSGRSTGDSPPSNKDSPSDGNTAQTEKHGEGCPKTKADLAQVIKKHGESPFAPSSLTTDAIRDVSPFAPSSLSTVRKSSDAAHNPMVACQGSSFPKVDKSADNIEVLSAWKTIRSHPQFQDADINDLCSQFASKARCDGTKVVLEPQGVHTIIESLKSKAL
ncbi:hypothetical protein PLEOSDRAFT_1111247 [Pleurotus ostreatus PC15]|uniref:BZIP domain-containing protein n=2 Tax=Pleurotus TaxID=5320 RepID=A0A067NQJ4_PLEO1|nr:hypothetical protein PLEOSDRAFT_1111247 [Pleurotus ostreatus PC15]